MKQVNFRKIAIAYELRFPLAWTLFFVIIGIIIQSIKSGNLVFFDFFIKNYIEWFRDFGSFVEPTYYSSEKQLFFAIISKWYYFFYTGGLISLLWKLLNLSVNKEYEFKDKNIKSSKIRNINN